MRRLLSGLVSVLVAATAIGGVLVGFGGLVVAVIALFRAAWSTVLWGLLGVPAGIVLYSIALIMVFRLMRGPLPPEDKARIRRCAAFRRAVKAEKRRRPPPPPHADWPSWWLGTFAEARRTETVDPHCFGTCVPEMRRDAGLPDLDIDVED